MSSLAVAIAFSVLMTGMKLIPVSEKESFTERLVAAGIPQQVAICQYERLYGDDFAMPSKATRKAYIYNVINDRPHMEGISDGGVKLLNLLLAACEP